MGMFTWKTSDTKKTIAAKQALIDHIYRYRKQPKVNNKLVHGNCYGQETAVTLLLPNGEKITGEYTGYGEIQTYGENHFLFDVYALIQAINDGLTVNDFRILSDAEREKLRDTVFSGDYKKIDSMVKLVADSSLSFDDVKPSKTCQSQGFMFDSVR